MSTVAGLTLGGVSALFQVFDSCDRLYRGHQRIHAFGQDFNRVKRMLDSHYMAVDQIAKRKLWEISNDNLKFQELKELLATIRNLFEDCNREMQKYASFESDVEGSSNPDISDVSGGHNMSSKATSPERFKDEAVKPTHLPHSRLSWWKRITSSNAKSDSRHQGDTHLIDEEPTLNIKSHQHILETSTVRSVAKRQKNASLSRQHSIPLYLRASWAHNGKHIEKIVDEIAKHVEILERTVRLRTTFSPVIPGPNEKLQKIQKCLLAIHHGLMSINKDSTHCKAFPFAIQLREDTEANASDLAQEEYLNVEYGAFVVNAQKSKDASLKCNKLLFIGSIDKTNDRTEPSLTLTSDMLSWDSLNEASPKGPVKHVGSFKSKMGYHPVLCDTSEDFCCSSNLGEIFSDSKYKERMSPLLITQMTRLILTSHVQLKKVMDVKKTNLRPECYCYFANQNDSFDPFEGTPPRITCPWLLNGFGLPQRRRLGHGSGVAPSLNVNLLELGLLIHQVCSGQPVHYGHGVEGLSHAKEKALREISIVRKMAGPPFDDLIEKILCLGNAAHSDSEDEGVETVKEENLLMGYIEALRLHESSVSLAVGYYMVGPPNIRSGVS